MSQNNPRADLRRAIQDELYGKMKFTGEIRLDSTTCLLYSTDASIYQIEPLGVVFPRSGEDLSKVMTLANEMGFPVLPRGSGSSLAGQAIGEGLILDCSRHLNHILEINPETNTALVEPGVILNALNRQVGQFQLQFGPDPASAERATLGGCIANNAAGAHSIIYGLTADHLLAADVILSDATTASFASQSLSAAQTLARGTGIAARLYQCALDIRQQYAADIRAAYPRTWRRVSGYNLNYLLPWSPAEPPLWAQTSTEWQTSGSPPLPYPPIQPGEINLAALLAGSEGTLALIHRATLRLVPRPRHTLLGVLSYPDIASACDAVPEILRRQPSAVELIPFSLVRLARNVPAYAHLVSFVDQFAHYHTEEAALLVIEFCGADPGGLRQQALACGEGIWVAESAEAQKNVWAVRKVGLGILMSRLGPFKPVSFIEDIAVPVEKLGGFIRAVEAILNEAGTRAEIYAHASAGCLHIRPILNLKSRQGVADLRQIALQVITVALSFGGAVSAEHGDGIARSEWITQAYGAQVVEAFRQLKQAADPNHLLNPGKIVDAPPMDTNLRYGSDYTARAWQPFFGSQGQPASQESLLDAIEHCNGAGVCRKSEGVMCPSFQASQEEMHSTRGRANLLRLMVSGAFEDRELGEQAVREALDLCLACKGCKSECPSGVDVAKLKYEFTWQDYTQRGRRRPLRDYLFGYLERFAQLGHPFSRLANPVLASRMGRLLLQLAGISARRALPAFTRTTFSSRYRQLAQVSQREGEVLLLSDAFSEYFHPLAGVAAVRMLHAAGYQTLLLPVLGAGRTLISKGFLDAARKHAERLIAAIQAYDPSGQLPIVGIEPSEIYTLTDEYLDMFPGDPFIRGLAQRAWMVDEYLLRPGASGKPRIDALLSFLRKPQTQEVLLHGHCYQKAHPPAPDGYPVGMEASASMLRRVGYTVQTIDAGCCGMAGAFGYEKEHADFSLKVGELTLLPAIRSASINTLIAAAGVSCQAQITDGTARQVWHPVELASHCLDPNVWKGP